MEYNKLRGLPFGAEELRFSDSSRLSKKGISPADRDRLGALPAEGVPIVLSVRYDQAAETVLCISGRPKFSSRSQTWQSQQPALVMIGSSHNQLMVPPLELQQVSQTWLGVHQTPRRRWHMSKGFCNSRANG